MLNSKLLTLSVFQGVQERANLTSPMLSKEDPIFNSLSHKLGHSVDEVGHRIHQALLRVSSPVVFASALKRMGCCGMNPTFDSGFCKRCACKSVVNVCLQFKNCKL